MARLRRVLRRRRLLFGLLAIPVVLTAYIVAAGSVSNALTARDLQAIAMLDVDRQCASVRGFDAQLRCVSSIQAAVQNMVTDMRCAERGQQIEPMDFVERGYGCCYDRARFMSKAMRHYGLETRKVSLYDGRYGIFSLFVPGLYSHSITEVRTERGWMGVDSNEPFILLTHSGRPVRFAELADLPPSELRQQPTPARFYGKGYLVIYGVYSRHGGFHGPNLPAPEIYYPDFVRYTLLRRD